MTKKQKRMLCRIIIAAVLMTVLGFIHVDGYLRFAFYVVPYFIIGYDILKKAAKGIIRGQIFDENFLMAIATVGAIAIALSGRGDYTEAVAVMLFYQIGELFQSYAVGKSRRNISALMDIRPDYANIEIDGVLTRVDPDEVEVGSVIIVQPGEKVPIDGVVIEGNSDLNTVALTGESMPRAVFANDEIISGCINMTGVIKVRTTKLFGESTVAKILDMVENASSRKSRSEAFISKFARYYTPAVCISALALGVIPPVINLITESPAMWGDWLYRALTFLVISCPCALVISIPLTFFAGIGGASKEGILIKGSNYLETLSKIDVVVMDKTGTLTKGVFEVMGVYHNSIDEKKLIMYAAYAECYSSHPISVSIKNAYGNEIDRNRICDIKEIAGQGIVAKIDNKKVAVGNMRLMNSQGISAKEHQSIGSVVYIGIDGRYEGCIVISDAVKPTSKKAIEDMKKAGISKIVMLTGDNEAVAGAVAKELGMDEYRSGLLPGDKVKCVEELISENKKGKLAFVGDGINDAPVLARADVGIAMGAMGSDSAIESADVVLMDDDPEKIAKAIKISRKCLRIVYQNIVFALGIKGICLVLGALGIANMWLAIFADVGVMVIAVLNAIRALNTK